MKNEDEIVKYTDRIRELIEKLGEITSNGILGLNSRQDGRNIVEGCFAGTVSIIESLYGANSSQMKSLFDIKKAHSKTSYSSSYEIESLSQALRGVLNNVLEELEKGLIKSIRDEVTGEVIGDLVQLSKTQLKGGYVSVAAVLASAALEDALKRKATELGVNVSGKSMDSIINALKAKSFLKGAQGPIVTSYTKLRNAAMHADWDKITEADVTGMIGFLEPFIIENFS